MSASFFTFTTAFTAKIKVIKVLSKYDYTQRWASSKHEIALNKTYSSCFKINASKYSLYRTAVISITYLQRKVEQISKHGCQHDERSAKSSVTFFTLNEISSAWIWMVRTLLPNFNQQIRCSCTRHVESMERESAFEDSTHFQEIERSANKKCRKMFGADLSSFPSPYRTSFIAVYIFVFD